MKSWEVPTEELFTRAADINAAATVTTELSNFWDIFWVFALSYLGHFGYISSLVLDHTLRSCNLLNFMFSQIIQSKMNIPDKFSLDHFRYCYRYFQQQYLMASLSFKLIVTNYVLPIFPSSHSFNVHVFTVSSPVFHLQFINTLLNTTHYYLHYFPSKRKINQRSLNLYCSK